MTVFSRTHDPGDIGTLCYLPLVNIPLTKAVYVGGSTLIIVYIAIFVGIIYLFAVMPQRRMRRAQAQLMTKLTVGVEIITTGGLYGTVTELEDGDTLLIEVAEDTEVRIAKAAISRILDDTSAADTPQPDPPESSE
jgi:preprotein translocase subunit YajC